MKHVRFTGLLVCAAFLLTVATTGIKGEEPKSKPQFECRWAAGPIKIDGQMDDAEAREHRPRVVFVDSDNRIVGTGSDPAEALPGSGLVSGR